MTPPKMLDREFQTLDGLARARGARLSLQLQNSGLEVMSASPCALRRVSRLGLARNGFQSWPLQGSVLPELEELDLALNEITSLEGAADTAPQLVRLRMDFNPLGQGWEGLVGLRSLHQLSLRVCGLTAVPEALLELVELRELRLDENALVELPAAVTRLSRLERVALRGNPLRSIEPLLALPNLRHVEVDYCAAPDCGDTLRTFLPAG